MIATQRKQNGASMVEYAILIAVIAGAALAAVNVFAPTLKDAFTSVGNKVTTSANGGSQ